LVVTHHPSTIVFDGSRATNLGTSPSPGRSFDRQLFGGDIALAVKECGSELLRFGVVADHFDPTHSLFANRAVGGMQDEEAAGHPFIDVAGAYGSRRRTIGSERMSYGHPSSKNCIERPIFRSRGGRLSHLTCSNIASFSIHLLLLSFG
jgi:hypothetical protein